jgi:hypothetical protein
MTVERHDLKADGISVGFEADCGFVTDLAVTDEGAVTAPLHKAPWLDENIADSGHLRRLQGDFFCAPFCGTSDGSGFHGWPANGHWTVAVTGPGLLRAVLDHAVMGATVIKELSVSDGHPFLYQRHLMIGGHGTIPVANHANINVRSGAKLSFSRKRWFETPGAVIESDPARGRSALAYPKRSEDGTAFPGLNGGEINLHRYPWADRTEDFVVAVEDPGSVLGWTAVVRPAEGDLYLSLRNPRQLPQTGLWQSNGGRDYAPWNGRHIGCLGVEEGAALHMLGLSSRETPDPLTAAGQPAHATLDPYGTVDIRHIIGAIRWPSGQAVAGVMLEGDVLTVTGDWGAERKLPIRGGWLNLPTQEESVAQVPRGWDQL